MKKQNYKSNNYQMSSVGVCLVSIFPHLLFFLLKHVPLDQIPNTACNENNIQHISDKRK